MILGFDIGGTKCAAITAKWENGGILILGKDKVSTDLSIPAEKMVEKLIELADKLLGGEAPEAIGVSCGGPLDSRKGIILGPPNLPGWDYVPIKEQLEKHYHVKANLQNDANACAVAEWKFGAGKGVDNMVFLTFGTGLGAGLILDGRLYSGSNDNAGEVGHIRLDRFGPVGYGKAGSFEGFCSGGGITQLGYTLALEAIQCGAHPLYFRDGMTLRDISARSIAEAARAGDETAIRVYKTCAEQLGRGLSILIDILNPQRIVIGSVFARTHDLLWADTQKMIEQEALSHAAQCCEVVPAALGEQIGDFAAVATALL